MRYFSLAPADLTYHLSYDALPISVSGAVVKYDGSISCFRWKNRSGNFQSYTYAYDGLGQLKQATYNELEGKIWRTNGNRYSVGDLTYDLNGNLVRDGNTGCDILYNTLNLSETFSKGSEKFHIFTVPRVKSSPCRQAVL